MTAIETLLKEQDGVVSRRQVLATGCATSEITRRLRRREWAQAHPGVYVDHTGPLSWRQRAWAAVLFSWPAALTLESAIRVGDGKGRRGPRDILIHVVVERDRHLVAPAGVRIHRSSGFAGLVQWNLGPPRLRYEHAVLALAASAARDVDAVAHLADACGSRRTTAPRLLAAAGERTRLPRRAWIEEVLTDVGAGTCSVLEHGYVDCVQRPHGLPEGQRQASHRHGDRTTFRDVDYDELGVVVELDGRLFHESAHARDVDMDRDLEAAADGSETLRISFGQVFERACATAGLVAAVLHRRGWQGELRTCPECG